MPVLAGNIGISRVVMVRARQGDSGKPLFPCARYPAAHTDASAVGGRADMAVVTTLQLRLPSSNLWYSYSNGCTFTVLGPEGTSSRRRRKEQDAEGGFAPAQDS